MKKRFVNCLCLLFIGFIFCCTISCNNKTSSFAAKEQAIVKDSVQQLVNSIEKNISQRGPVAWLNYFEDSPDFFMASDGLLVFPNIDTARNFINNVLVKNMISIKLKWDHVRIDPLTVSLSGVSANFHEDAFDSTGKKSAYDGYFSGIAIQTSNGWKLHNAHWSVNKHEK